ncbi:MAG: phosphonate metabolism transcriptional regulator PhnF [Gammaproteobacteria bacterium]|nr:phosphonate metabolism transcriptional regulator PhnF [Gammaproteobacteria bacterium]
MSVYLVARNEGGLPIYRQIRDVLVNEIHDLYKAGDSLPAETELALRFGVNRHTLRRAIDELVSDGCVERRHGKGVFVLEPAINYSIGSSTRFTETLQSQGKNTTSRVLRKLVIPAKGTVASRLQIQEGEDIIFIETLRSVESNPFCIISHFIPLHKFYEILESYEMGSLHEYIRMHFGIELKRSESLISSVVPDIADASLLNMPRHAPMLRVKSLNLDINSNEAVEYAVTRFRGDATQLSIKH